MLYKLYDAKSSGCKNSWYNRMIVCCVDNDIYLKVPLIYFVLDHKLAATD